MQLVENNRREEDKNASPVTSSFPLYRPLTFLTAGDEWRLHSCTSFLLLAYLQIPEGCARVSFTCSLNLKLQGRRQPVCFVFIFGAIT